ncbi:MAG: two-component system response regulator [Deltaproteobacteria bacterium]|nr:MAG: two-component system response regulator [Deltaproteobacteria bacterium]
MLKNSGNHSPHKAHILIVDDEPAILSMLQRAMKTAGHNCTAAQDGKSALALLSNTPVDVVITDINMPEMSGIELATKILTHFSADVIVMTGQAREYQYDEIINIGASDFVEKPFSIQEIILRVQRVLRERRLKEDAKNSHSELKEAYVDSIHRLVMASEFKDEDTGDHIIRIGDYSSLISRKLNQSDQFIETIGFAAPMHDVGKIGIPDKILLKPGKLTTDEFNIVKRHTLIGAKLLSLSKSRILQMAEEIALSHHEKFNGKGYPKGLSGETIPLSGRIVAIADTFDALISKRPYKDPYPPEMINDIIRREKGAHFDPDITDIFLENFDAFVKIRNESGLLDPINLEEFKLSERDQIRIQT